MSLSRPIAYGFELFQPCSCQVYRRILVNQTDHVFVFERHDPRRDTCRLPDNVSVLTHGDAMLFLPLPHGLKIPALPVDAEVWIWFVAYVDPVICNTTVSTMQKAKSTTYG
jgi:hypothetical protein